MKQVTRNITVDLSRRSQVRVVFATQNDRDSRRICIRLTDDGKPYPVTKKLGVTVNFQRSDGKNGAYLAEVADDGSIIYTVDRTVLVESGQTYCTVTLSDEDGLRLTSAPFVLDVEPTLYSGSEISESEALSITEQMMASYTAMQASEAERVEAEDVRRTRDIQIGYMESVRNIAEGDRATAESKRSSAEQARVQAEQSRAEAEQSRATAESKRAADEAQRQEYYESVDVYMKSIEDVQKSFINQSAAENGWPSFTMLQVYPVGSIYMSVEAVDPAYLFGGVWERLKDRFLLGAGDTYAAGKRGGAAGVTLSAMHLPPHAGHIYANDTVCNNGNAKGYYLPKSAFETTDGGGRGWNEVTGGEMYPDTKSIGEGEAHENMPPYLAVYMWKRIA